MLGKLPVDSGLLDTYCSRSPLILRSRGSLCLPRAQAPQPLQAGLRHALFHTAASSQGLSTRSRHPGCQSLSRRALGVPHRRDWNTSRATGDLGTSSSTSDGPDADDDQGRSRGIRRLLAFLRPPLWLSNLVAALLQRLQLSGVTWRQWVLRVGSVVVALLLLAAARDVLASHARTSPREVFYSDFVTLLDRGSVNAAWLESGEGRLNFNVVSGAVAPASGTVATAASAARATASLAATTSGTAGASFGATALSPEAALAGLSSTAVKAISPTLLSTNAASPAVPRQNLYIKLADKQDPLLTQRVLAAGVRFCVVQPSFQAALTKTLISALAIWLPLMPIFFLFKRLLDSRGGLGGTSKKAKSLIQSPATTFADVAGVDGAKRELAEVVQLLRAEKAALALAARNGGGATVKAGVVGVNKLRVKLPSGVLLCGPPGTGKTLLAKAVAGEAGVPFLSVSASEFVELFVGRGAARVRELFAEARQSAPSVIFIDELDAVGARRGMGFNDERDQTLNQLLTELDGFDARPGVLFLAATNRADVLDPALLRPGRLARKVVVPLPDTAGRRDILAVHLRNIPLDAALAGVKLTATCERLAQATPGFSGAELANVANEAVLMASRADVEEVGMTELLQGVQRTRFGIDGRDGGVGKSGGAGGGLTRNLRKWLLDVASGNDSSELSRQKAVKVMNG